MSRKTRPVGSRIPETDLARIEAAAALEDVSRSRFISNAAARAARQRLRDARDSRPDESSEK